MEINVENALYVLNKYLKNVNKSKYEHSLRVAKVSKILAKKWNAPLIDAYIVGLLHDIGKGITKREMLEMCIQNNVTIYDFELFETLTALHGKVSSIIFKKEFDDTDKKRYDSIAHAIEYHVAGGEDKMSILDKIIYVADNIEPQKQPYLFKKVLNSNISINRCISIIIYNKKKKSKERKLEHNPLIDLTKQKLQDR